MPSYLHTRSPWDTPITLCQALLLLSKALVSFVSVYLYAVCVTVICALVGSLSQHSSKNQVGCAGWAYYRKGEPRQSIGFIVGGRGMELN